MSNQENIKSRIIEALHQCGEEYLSGEELSRDLGISRAAVWKQISSLKKMGYRIDSTPSRGHRLVETPDKLFPWEVLRGLETESLGRVIHYYNSVDSTNLLAYKLGSEGAREGCCVIAETQTSGRGRLGRAWISPAEKNLYLSVILRPQTAVGDAPQISLLTATALCLTINEWKDDIAGIKWPNDVLINMKKTAGILTEIKIEGGLVDFIVVGIGVNLNMASADIPEELKEIATSMRIALKREVSRIDFLRKLLLNLESWYKLFLEEGFRPIRDKWEQYSVLTGRNVKVAFHDKQIEGVAEGLDHNGLLVIRLPGGGMYHLPAGDVTVLKSPSKET